MRPHRWSALLPELRWSDAVVVGVLVTLIAITALTVGQRSDDAGAGTAVAVFVAGVLQTVPVLWRRERPVGALVAFAVTVVPVWALTTTAAGWTWAVLAFGVARRSRPGAAAIAIAATTLLAAVLAGFAGDPSDPLRAVGMTIGLLVNMVPILGAAIAIAVVARVREARLAARRRQDERERLADVLTAQRDRLAGDLRDLVAVRVERVVARIRALDGADTDRDARLTAIAAEARAALAGMRRALTLLRAPDDGHAPEPVPVTTAEPGHRWLPTRGGLGLAAVVAGLVAAGAGVAAALAPRVRPGTAADLLAVLDVDPGRPLGLVPVAVQVLALAWWRRAPLPALVVATAGSAGASLLGSTNMLTEASWSVLVFGAGLGAGVVASAVTVAACSAAVLVTTLTVGLPAAVSTSGASWVLAYLLVPATWGLGVLQRRSAVAEALRAEERAARDAAEEVRAQRLGLARELHDVLAHELSALVVTLHAARLDPSPTTLAAIAEAGERIAGALPTLLEGHDQPAAGHGPLDADAVDALVAPVRDAGLPVSVEVDGPAPADRPEADLLAARIVTEALTNALRHAGPTPTRVAVRHDDEHVTVEVADDGLRPGHSPGREGSGLGLVGMRERAALVGGSVEAGPAGPGWRVVAHLPRRPAGLLLEGETAGAGSAARRTITTPVAT